MLEHLIALAADGPPRAISGVLNGTCNFVLDQIAQGAGFEQAVAEAQTAGFAEADPTLDLDGSDAAQKLAIIARLGMGEALAWRTISRRGIDRGVVDQVRVAQANNSIVRLVASCERGSGGVLARVEPIVLPSSHPLARVGGAGNCLITELDDGNRHVLRGAGAGRWPTAESVLSDVFRVARRCETRDSGVDRFLSTRRAGQRRAG